MIDGATYEHDITSEEWREYVYNDRFTGNEVVYTIVEPVKLYLKKGEGHLPDSHRVVDADGTAHYPVKGWTAIRWKADPEVSF